MSANSEHSSEPANLQVTLREAQQQELVITGATPRFSVYDHEANTITVMSSLTTHRILPAIEQEFYALASRWRAKTAHLSLAHQRSIDFDYQQIIGMGRDVLPIIIRELRSETPSDWFWALDAITRGGGPPISEEEEGHVHLIAEKWIQWGIDNGYAR